VAIIAALPISAVLLVIVAGFFKESGRDLRERRFVDGHIRQ